MLQPCEKREATLGKNNLMKDCAQDSYQSLFNNMLDGIFQIDLNGNYLLVNPAYAHIHGYKPEEMLTINISETWVSLEEWNIVFREVKKRDLKNILKHFLRKDGSSGWLELSIKTKRDPDGNPIAYEGVARDISERRIIEMSEREARERAEFLIDLMTHDLNNINQGMLLPLELISQDATLPQKYKKPVEIAITQIQRSTELIKNVKKLQNVIQQPIKLEKRDLYNDIKKAIDAVRRTFVSKELKIICNIKKGELSVYADDFLPDLFFNLLHNSMKFDKNQTVIIEIDIEKKNNGTIEISLSDHGPGIPNEEKTRVLLRKRGGKGSGIGLTLVNYLIERYGGRISIQDRINGKVSEGAKIVLTLQEG